MPSSMARRSTRITSSWSWGSPHMPLPVILIAPNPSRWMGSFPPIRNSPAFAAGLTPALCLPLTSADFFFAPITSPRKLCVLHSDSDAGRVQRDSSATTRGRLVLHLGEPTIHKELRSCDVAAVVRREKDHSLGDF